MGLPQLKHPGYTLEDWKTWEGRWELIDGVAFDMTPAPSPAHQDLVGSTYFQLRSALDAAKQKSGGGNCRVFVAPVDVFLDADVVQPDVLVVCDPAKVSPRGIEGPPDLVVEILSPSTASKDAVRKRWLYEAAGVPEYLMVDPVEAYGLLLRLEGGRYQEAARIEWGSAVALLGGRIEIDVA